MNAPPRDPPPSVTAEDRLDRLEARVRWLEEVLRNTSVSASLDQGPGASARPASSAETAELLDAEDGRLAPVSSLALNILAQAGWSFLALAGASLVRALTDRGTVPTTPGVALGLLYALGVIVLADRAARRGNRLTAGFLGSTGIFIADAIVAETTTRFGFLSATGGLVILASFTALVLAAGRRDGLPALAWVATLACCGTAFILATMTGARAESGILLLLLGTATFWLDDARWSWRLLPWPAALGADALSIWATWRVLVPLAPGQSRTTLTAVLALGLPLLWLGSLFLRALMRRPAPGGLAVVQTSLALVVGFGGALRLAHAAGGGADALAGLALACGGGSYAFAFFHERGPGLRDSRLYWSWLALVLTLAGSALLLPHPAPPLFWSTLAVGATILSRRYEPGILRPQAAVLVGAAAIASGLLARSLAALAAGGDSLRLPAPAALTVLAAATLVAVLLLAEPPAGGLLPGFTAGLVSALGLGAMAVLALRHVASADRPGPLAAVRTVVVSVLAFALARAARALSRRELRGLAYLALVGGGLKLLVEDVPGGSPGTLFVAFVFYGAALLLVPRVLRGGTPTPLADPGL